MGTFDLHQDHDALRQTVRGFAADVFSETEIRRLIGAESVLE